MPPRCLSPFCRPMVTRQPSHSAIECSRGVLGNNGLQPFSGRCRMLPTIADVVSTVVRRAGTIVWVRCLLSERSETASVCAVQSCPRQAWARRPSFANFVPRQAWAWRRRAQVLRCLRVAALCATTLGACATQLRAEQPAGSAALVKAIQQVDLVHFSHTDFGFTDHPVICRELYRRYLEIPLDAALATMNKPPQQPFYWTAETTVPVDDWWQAASAERRGQFCERCKPANWKSRPCP